MTHSPKKGLNASIFIRIEISRILHNSFAIAWGNCGSHNFSVNTNYQLIYIKRTLYNTCLQFIYTTGMPMGMVNYGIIYDLILVNTILHTFTCLQLYQWGNNQTLIITSPSFYKKTHSQPKP